MIPIRQPYFILREIHIIDTLILISLNSIWLQSTEKYREPTSSHL